MSKNETLAAIFVTAITKALAIFRAWSCLVAGRPNAAFAWMTFSGILLGFLIGLSVTYRRTV